LTIDGQEPGAVSMNLIGWQDQIKKFHAALKMMIVPITFRHDDTNPKIQRHTSAREARKKRENSAKFRA
jgi:hypothetical protein